MSSAIRAEEHASEWIDVEQKVPEENNPFRGKSMVRVKIPNGKKGKRGKVTTISIPRSFLTPEVKRNQNSAFWNAETLDKPTAASVYSFFTQIQQGVANSQRIGDAIRVKRLTVRFYVEQSAGVDIDTIALAFVKDREPAAGTPGWTTVWNGIGAAGDPAYGVAVPNEDARFRFEYLRRYVIPLRAYPYYTGSAVARIGQTVTLMADFPFAGNGLKVAYNASTGSPYEGCEVILYGWGFLTSNTTKVTASYEVFYTDA